MVGREEGKYNLLCDPGCELPPLVGRRENRRAKIIHGKKKRGYITNNTNVPGMIQQTNTIAPTAEGGGCDTTFFFVRLPSFFFHFFKFYSSLFLVCLFFVFCFLFFSTSLSFVYFSFVFVVALDLATAVFFVVDLGSFCAYWICFFV